MDLLVSLVLASASALPAPTNAASGDEASTVDAFGDPLPPGAVARMGSMRLRHSQPLNWAGFAAGDGMLVTASISGAVASWSADEGRLAAILREPGQGARPGDVSRDGGRVVLATGAGAYSWDAATASGVLVGEGAILARVSPDGAFLAALGHDGVVRVHSAEGGEPTASFEIEGFSVSDVAFAPSGAAVVLLGLNRNKLLGRKGTEDEPTTMLVVRPIDGSEPRAENALDDVKVMRVFFLDDDRLLAAEEGGRFHVVSIVDGSIVKTIEGRNESVTPVTIAPTRDLVAIPHAGGRVRVLETGEWSDVAILNAGHVEGAPLAFSSGGAKLAIASALSVSIWDVRKGEALVRHANHDGPVAGIAYATESVLVSASYDRTLRAWDAESGENRFSERAHTDWINGLSVSAAGDVVATCSRDGRAHVYGVDGTERHRLAGHEGAVTGVAVSPDGSTVASVAADKTMIVWDARTGDRRTTTTGLEGLLFSASFTKGGEHVAVAGVEFATFDAASGELVLSLGRLEASITAHAMSPDGKRVALGLANRSLRIVDLESRDVLELPKQAGRVSALCFSPDGSLIASSAQSDRAVRLWDTKSGEAAGSIEGFGVDVLSLAFSPDGTRVATGAMDGSVLVWSVR